MRRRRMKKYIHVKEYAAEVEVDLLYNEDEWSPYLSVRDASKLDEVRLALQKEEIQHAARLANIYHLTPINEQHN
jgi:hypothetical protein